MSHKTEFLIIGGLIAMSYFSPTVAEADSDALSLQIVNPADLYNPSENGYSHAIIAKGGSSVAYLAGQGGEDINGDLSDDFAQQVQQASANLNSSLKAVGASPQQVTKLTTYVVNYDQSKLGPMTDALVALFGEHLPAQTLVPVPRLALDGMLFEVDAIAILD